MLRPLSPLGPLIVRYSPVPEPSPPPFARFLPGFMPFQ
jgi:hypothetical protein